MNRIILVVLLLMLFASASACLMINPPPQQPPIPVEEPDPDVAENPNKIAGQFCSFERILPDEIKFNERFQVTVIVEAKRPVQSIYVEEDGWFGEFRRIQEPAKLWLEIGAGEKRSFVYDVELLMIPSESHLIMFGSAICNIGGLGESEVLRLESKLKVAVN